MKSLSFIKAYTPSHYKALTRWYRWSCFLIICTISCLFLQEIPLMLQLKNKKKEKAAYTYQTATFVTALDHKHTIKKQLESLQKTIQSHEKHVFCTKKMRDQLVTIGRACSPMTLVSVILDKHKVLIQAQCRTSEEVTKFCHALVQSSLFTTASITSLHTQKLSEENSCLLSSITAIPLFNF
ncbi:MAG TPA: hypothetical protein VEK38_02745 [Candidatus Bathyarchaeia archaeon]|nr:hypothetical protein [Candidatus Bathyarchaeia archaeon]